MERAHQESRTMNEKRLTPRQIIMNSRTPVINPKSFQREQASSVATGLGIRIVSGFSVRSLEVGRQWSNTFKILGVNDLQPRNLYSTKSSIKYEGGRVTFSDT